MRLIINAGHTKLGVGTGAVGLLTESVETRKIAYELMKQLTDTNIEVIPAVFDKSNNNLKQAVSLSNDNLADMFISIHLNAGGGRGSEIYTWKGVKKPLAVKILQNMAAIGFKNRGIKDGSGLYVIKNTKCEALLIEICFVDSEDDNRVFKQVGYEKIAKAIANAIETI